MRLSPSFALFFVTSIVLYPARMQEPPKPSESPRPQSTQGKQTPESVPELTDTASATETNVFLKEGTAVKLKLLHTLNSKTVVTDDPLNFSVAEDLVVDGKTLVKAGAFAVGRVRHAKPARTLGRGAELELEMQYLKAGRIRVPLRGSQARQGEGKTGDTVALVVLFGLSGLVKHGSEIEVKEGSLFTAYVDQGVTIPTPPGSSGTKLD